MLGNYLVASRVVLSSIELVSYIHDSTKLELPQVTAADANSV
jgi:hypothetical protein